MATSCTKRNNQMLPLGGTALTSSVFNSLPHSWRTSSRTGMRTDPIRWVPIWTEECVSWIPTVTSWRNAMHDDKSWRTQNDSSTCPWWTTMSSGVYWRSTRGCSRQGTVNNQENIYILYISSLQIYKLYRNQKNAREIWSKTLWVDLDPNFLTEGVESYLREFRKMTKAVSRPRQPRGEVSFLFWHKNFV